MNYFLALQNTYEQAEIGLFTNEPKLIDVDFIPKTDASKLLIPRLGNFLKKHNLKITDLLFIVVNQGPAPFTTLRVMIATANGLSFATRIPLIGVDALQAAHQEWQNSRYPLTIIMFNAFAFDVYSAIVKNGTIIFKGCKNIDTLLDELRMEKALNIRFIGNGASLYTDKIKLALGDRALISDPNPAYCSLNQIGIMGYDKWHSGQKGTHLLLPLYLKKT